MLNDINNLSLYISINNIALAKAQSKNALIFIHGAQHDSRVWEAQAIQLLGSFWDVCVIDLPGHGKSNGNPQSSIEEYARQIQPAIESLGYENIIFIGHSMGSLIALELSHLVRPRFAGLVLLGCAFPMQVSPALLDLTLNDVVAATHAINKWSHSGFYDGATAFLQKDIVSLNFTIMQDNLREHGSSGLYCDLKACNDYSRGFEMAEKIDSDVLFLVGTKDKMTPMKMSYEFAHCFKKAVVIECIDGGHALMTENSLRVNAEIQNYAARIFNDQGD